MFRAARCSSSGGPIVSPQPLVSSPSVSSRTVCGWRAYNKKRKINVEKQIQNKGKKKERKKERENEKEILRRRKFHREIS